MNRVLYVVIESSSMGDSVLGVYSSIEQARASLPVVDVAGLADYRIEWHVLDEVQTEPRAWRLVLARDGEVLEAEPVLTCSCEDDQRILAGLSFIAEGGEWLQLLVWSPTRGLAINAATRRGRELLADGTWDTQSRALDPISASTVGA